MQPWNRSLERWERVSLHPQRLARQRPGAAARPALSGLFPLLSCSSTQRCSSTWLPNTAQLSVRQQEPLCRASAQRQESHSTSNSKDQNKTSASEVSSPRCKGRQVATVTPTRILGLYMSLRKNRLIRCCIQATQH